MTEEDAKTKWCPFVRFYNTDAYIPSEEQLKQASRCIGSACMAWRIEHIDKVPTGKITAQKGGGSMYHMAPEYEDVPHGYCGLAGRP